MSLLRIALVGSVGVLHMRCHQLKIRRCYFLIARTLTNEGGVSEIPVFLVAELPCRCASAYGAHKQMNSNSIILVDDFASE